jgi:hypothetical protein
LTVTILAGSTSSQIQTAFSGSSTGETIQFDAGDYRITSALAPKANQVITASNPSGAKPRLFWSKNIAGSTNGTWTGPTSGRWTKTVTGGVPGPTIFDYGSSHPPQNLHAEYTEQILYDGVPLNKVGVLDAGVVKGAAASTVGAGDCFIDYDANVVTIGSNPGTHELEITQGQGGVTSGQTGVELAYLELTGTCDRGVDIQGTFWNVHDCVIRGHQIGMHLADDATVSATQIIHNVWYGLVGADSARVTFGPDNEVAYNTPISLRQDFPPANAPWGSGAWKIVGSDQHVVFGNSIHDNGDAGAWYDTRNQRLNFHDNTAFNNDNANFWYEISYGQLSLGDANLGQQAHCTDNVFSGGADRNVFVSASRNLEIARNTIRGANTYQIEIRDQTRSQTPPAGITYRGIGNHVHDNDIWLDKGKSGVSLTNFADGKAFTTNDFDSNTYHLPSPEGTHFQWQTGTGTTTATSAMNSTTWRQKGNDHTAGDSPPGTAVYTDLTAPPPPPTVPQLTLTGGSGTGSKLTDTFIIPASIAVGQMMQLSVYNHNSATSISTPAGWNVAVASQSTGSSPGTGAVFYKTATSGDQGATVTITLSGATARRLAWVWVAFADSVGMSLDSAAPSPILTPDAPTSTSGTTPAATPTGSAGILAASVFEKSNTVDTTGPTFTAPAGVSIADHYESKSAGGLNVSAAVYTKSPISAAEAAKTFTSAQTGWWFGATVLYRFTSTTILKTVSAAQQQRAAAPRFPRRTLRPSTLLALAAVSTRFVLVRTFTAAATTAASRVASWRRTLLAAPAQRLTSPTLPTSTTLTTLQPSGLVASVSTLRGPTIATTQATTVNLARVAKRTVAAATAAVVPLRELDARLTKNVVAVASATAVRGQIYTQLATAAATSAAVFASAFVKLVFLDASTTAIAATLRSVSRVLGAVQAVAAAMLRTTAPVVVAGAVSATASRTFTWIRSATPSAVATSATFAALKFGYSRIVGFGRAIAELVDLFGGQDAPATTGSGEDVTEPTPSMAIVEMVGGSPTITDE